MNGAPLALGLAALAALASAKPRGSRAAVAARAPGALESAAPGLGALRAAMVAVASEDTAYGKDYAGRADRLALHCGAVSYVVQRRYGGRVLSARVRGESHLWNRLPGGVEVDLSGSQYGGDGWRPLAKGRVEPERKTVNPRFALFEERVHEALGLRGSRAAVLSPSRRAEFDDLAEAFRERVNGRDDRVIDAMRTFAKKHKIGVLGAGAARAVFSVPEGALKIEMGWAPFTDNRNEALLWGAAPARVAEHLVPVLAHAYDHAWLLMPEVEIGGAVSVQAQGLLDACGLTDFKYHESNVTKDGRLVDYGYVHSYSLFKECRERGQAQRAKPQPVAGSAAKKAFPRARVVAVEHQGSGPARRRVETLSCGHTRAPGWKRGRMMPLLEVGDAVACSACRKAPSGSQNGVKAFAARDVFTLFQDQTDADEAYFDLFSPWKRWSLRLLNPRQIQSYTEPGAIQNGFSDKEDEEAARRYASLGIENAPPIFVKPFPHPPYAWVHIDGQTRARAALLSGKPIYGYAPILES